jgi:hypothetical protein
VATDGSAHTVPLPGASGNDAPRAGDEAGDSPGDSPGDQRDGPVELGFEVRGPESAGRTSQGGSGPKDAQ